MTLVKWHPYRSLRPRYNYWDSFINEFFGDNWSNTGIRTSHVPAIDIKENNDQYTVVADLPGISKKDIKVNVKDNVLEISADRKNEIKDDSNNYHYSERRHGNFQRSFRLPEAVKEKDINAKFKDGVLSINIPKMEEVKSSEVEIKIA
jgi:HSP20 family protein